MFYRKNSGSLRCAYCVESIRPNSRIFSLSMTLAPTGQTRVQAQQRRQRGASVRTEPSASPMAPEGQERAHSPHRTQVWASVSGQMAEGWTP